VTIAEILETAIGVLKIIPHWSIQRSTGIRTMSSISVKALAALMSSVAHKYSTKVMDNLICLKAIMNFEKNQPLLSKNIL
jgi:hypothetical protein